MRDDESMARALGAELEALRGKLKKRTKRARRGDPDGVHDARTTVRRARVALDAARAIHDVDARAIDRADSRLRALAKRLGPTRDADVLVADVEARARRDARLRDLRRRAAKLRKSRARGLRRDLSKRESRRVLRAMKRAARALAAAAPQRDGRPEPSLVRHLRDAAIWRAWGRVAAFERAPRGTPDALHRLRAACRELRYVLELFAGALPHAAARLAGDLARLTKRLGAMHDDHAAIVLIDTWLRDGEVEPSGAVSAYLAERASARDAVVASFEPTWRALDSAGFRRALAHALTGERIAPRTIAPLESAVH